MPHLSILDILRVSARRGQFCLLWDLKLGILKLFRDMLNIVFKTVNKKINLKNTSRRLKKTCQSMDCLQVNSLYEDRI